MLNDFTINKNDNINLLLFSLTHSYSIVCNQNKKQIELFTICFITCIDSALSTFDTDPFWKQQTELILSYQLCNYNTMHLKLLEINRTFQSNLIQTIIYNLFYKLISMEMFLFILFIVVFNINLLCIFGYNLMNRLLTESISYPSDLYNNVNIKNNRYNINILLFSLTHSYSIVCNENKKQIELFDYLSLIKLLNIYSKQIYFNIIINTSNENVLSFFDSKIIEIECLFYGLNIHEIEYNCGINNGLILALNCNKNTYFSIVTVLKMRNNYSIKNDLGLSIKIIN